MKVFKLSANITDEIREIDVDESLTFDGFNKDCDGDIMYSNTHFKTYESAKNKQIKELEAGIISSNKNIENLKKDLDFWESKKDAYYIKLMRILGKI